jgi:hypothetical protein
MTKKKRPTNVKDNKENLSDKLNEVPVQTDSAEMQSTDEKPEDQTESENSKEDRMYDKVFDQWENGQVFIDDFKIDVPIDSLESAVGYTSLFRQMHQSFVRMVAFYRSSAGGALSVEEARKEAFHSCKDEKEAKKLLNSMMRLPLDCLNFVDLLNLQEIAPRVAERFWERTKLEGRKEFESGHLAANITFPVGYMKGVWNIARYLGVRESFVDDWNPKGGIEVALIDMMAQSWFQWQYWIEQTVKRSETRESEIHPEYSRWLAQHNRELKSYGITEGYWNRPYVSEQQALEHSVQMADRFNRIFMRTLRQLRDLRRYTPVTINNPNQVNIAADGGQQINLAVDKEIITEDANSSNAKLP